uniref:Uncharacterized protein n=1 Tax=Anguilla anguilla TaxID=7936 RepID=A0A0E9P9M3_ANGAN
MVQTENRPEIGHSLS